MTRRSSISAISKGKCPRCRQGDMFTHNPFVLSKIASMPDKCETCSLRFETEPGFYYGAMYVSYAFSVAILFLNIVTLYFIFNDPAIWVYISSVAVTSTLLYPLVFRYSRIIFLHVFGGIKYDSSLMNEVG